jgi:hypothetical protein
MSEKGKLHRTQGHLPKILRLHRLSKEENWKRNQSPFPPSSESLPKAQMSQKRPSPSQVCRSVMSFPSGSSPISPPMGTMFRLEYSPKAVPSCWRYGLCSNHVVSTQPLSESRLGSNIANGNRKDTVVSPPTFCDASQPNSIGRPFAARRFRPWSKGTRRCPHK